jgi:hypothetical protein
VDGSKASVSKLANMQKTTPLYQFQYLPGPAQDLLQNLVIAKRKFVSSFQVQDQGTDFQH